MSVIFTVQDAPDDDTLPGPYDPLEGEIVFATWFDLRPVTGFFSKCPFLMLREGEKELGLTKLLQVLKTLGRVVLFLLAVIIEFARIVGGEC